MKIVLREFTIWLSGGACMRIYPEVVDGIFPCEFFSALGNELVCLRRWWEMGEAGTS